MRIYWVDDLESGNLGMMARPRGGDWLEEEVKRLVMFDVSLVVSLLERAEEVELELQQEAAICNQYGIRFEALPIPDRGVPNGLNSFKTLVDTVCHTLKDGQKAVVHCRMGIGRSSLFAAACMVCLGANPDGIFQLLSAKRTLEVPDTKKQVDWLMDNFS